MLARWIEEAGVPTVVVTMMPEVAVRLGAPRVVGVEFPFGHTFGLPNDFATQRRVLYLALQVLSGSEGPQVRVDFDGIWPIPFKDAYKDWQPKVPSPIISLIIQQRRNR